MAHSYASESYLEERVKARLSQNIQHRRPWTEEIQTSSRPQHPPTGSSSLSNPAIMPSNARSSSRVAPLGDSICATPNIYQIRSNVQHSTQQLSNPQQLIAYPSRLQLSTLQKSVPSPLGTKQNQLVPANHHIQWAAQPLSALHLPKTKIAAFQTLNQIAPIEYVEKVRRLSRPIVENSKSLEKKIKEKLCTEKHTKKRKYYFVMASIVALFSMIMYGAQDGLTESIMNSVMGEIKEGSIVAKKWQNVPIPINFCFYLFGISNGAEFVKGARPYLQEYGPFCHHLYRKRRILEWKEGTVKYMERLKFEFVPEDSESLDVKLHSINYPIFIAVYFAKNLLEKYYVGFIGPVVYNAINLALRMTGESLVDYTTARLLIEGKPIKILSYFGAILQPFRAIGIPIPEYFGAAGLALLNHSFGWTSTLSSGELGPYEAYTRTENGHLVGDVRSFKGSPTFPTWKAPCNNMRSGDGMFWERPVHSDVLTLSIQIVCRLLTFFKDEEHLFHGAQVVRYKLDPQMFNMSLRRNRCFCEAGRTLADCNGWHSISPCLALPVGLSFPHFYQSPNLLRTVEGLTPNEEEHGGYIDMEPRIAAPVNARIGIQVLFDIRKLTTVPSMNAIREVKMPVVWFKIHAGAQGALAILLFVGSNLVRYASYAWLFGGLGFSGILLYLGNRQGSKQQQRGPT